MRIAALGPAISGMVNPIYRLVLPMQELGARGHEVYVRWGEEPNPQRLLGFDVVDIWRCCDPATLAIAQTLRRAGVAVIWDDDDDLTRLPKSDVKYRRSGGGFRLFSYGKETLAMMRAAHVVTTPSDVLCARFHEKADVPTRVLENYVPNTFGLAGRRGAGVTVGWVAAQEHDVDVAKLGLGGVFERLLDAFAELRVVTVGVKLPLRTARYEHVRGVEHDALPGVLSGFDIGIAPIVDVAWNQARSNVKLKEYAACGVPWLASPIGPYAELGEREGGRLVADDRWEQELASLIRDGRARRKLGKRAARWGKSQTIAHNVHRWEDVFEEAIALAAASAASATATR